MFCGMGGKHIKIFKSTNSVGLLFVSWINTSGNGDFMFIHWPELITKE